MEHIHIITNLNDNNTYETFLSESGIRIPVLYEDNHIIVVVKPQGVLSQSDGSNAQDILTLLKEYIKNKYNKPGDVYLGLVHRLDRPVSGVMVFARTSKAASRLSLQIREKTVTKKYFAIVHGAPQNSYGTIKSKLLKNSSNVVTEDEDGKESVLHYKIANTNIARKISLINVHLETGRSHQIRVQLANMGNPILGDKKYGDENESYRGDIALFSYSFSFKHPTRDINFKIETVPFFRQEWANFPIESYNDTE